MGLFTVNESSTTYFADFALYGVTVLGLSTFLLIASPAGEQVDVHACAAPGLGSRTVTKYFFPRFILHGVTTAFWDHFFRSIHKQDSKVNPS